MTTDLNTLSTELAQATADYECLQRLEGAKERMETLQAQLDSANEAEAQRKADKANEEREALFARITDVTISEAPGRGGNTLLNRLFRVSWTAPKWDFRTNRSAPARQEVVGFHAVPADVLACIIEKHPELIPADIKALRPGDPAGAMGEYFASKRRGYSRGPVNS